MAQLPDLVSLLGLDPCQSRSSFGGQHRTLLISKDFDNTADFVFNNLLQSFSRKDPRTPLLLVTMSQNWSNYSAIAAKCGSNLRRTESMGNIEVLNIMGEYLNLCKTVDSDFNICQQLQDSILDFIKKHTPDNKSTTEATVGGESSPIVSQPMKPLIIMIDDLSVLSAIGAMSEQVYRLVSTVDASLRKRSSVLAPGQLSVLVLQSTVTHIRESEKLRDQHHHQQQQDDNLNYAIANICNQCDIVMALKPLDTGYSTRVDGTIKIIDNRLPPAVKLSPSQASTINTNTLPSLSSMLSLDTQTQIGMTRTFFYKLSDRRARLTSSALIM